MSGSATKGSGGRQIMRWRRCLIRERLSYRHGLGSGDSSDSDQIRKQEQPVRALVESVASWLKTSNIN